MSPNQQHSEGFYLLEMAGQNIIRKSGGSTLKKICDAEIEVSAEGSTSAFAPLPKFVLV